MDAVTTFEPPKGVTTVVTAVSADEPCFFLAEENRLSKSGRTMCRYQLLRVVRSDSLVTAYVYLGKASQFAADPFYMQGGWVDDTGRGEAVHTVGELQAGANELRSRKPHRELEPRDLQDGFLRHIEERERRVKHTSTFGYGGSMVRA